MFSAEELAIQAQPAPRVLVMKDGRTRMYTPEQKQEEDKKEKVEEEAALLCEDEVSDEEDEEAALVRKYEEKEAALARKYEDEEAAGLVRDYELNEVTAKRQEVE